jgi:hypothetical protein
MHPLRPNQTNDQSYFPLCVPLPHNAKSKPPQSDKFPIPLPQRKCKVKCPKIQVHAAIFDSNPVSQANSVESFPEFKFTPALFFFAGPALSLPHFRVKASNSDVISSRFRFKFATSSSNLPLTMLASA